ncbi:capsule biosynthesis protein [Pelagovum pacificum]|uniref:Capsule biosynthesis protein n=1 Tax=Pelagovum pacificum TaxID=2588711 RepID=A0A5C5GA60_9RHOB|nr:capsule biosynthesis protein [Pelagovum pacificum]QQA42359.1 capsule biosynthesis protein [Pelagovum pacificum]TNY31443.1 capsule biosynthesis protein [Pelagovum pacificum]
MTTKPKARKFRIRRGVGPGAGAAAAAPAADPVDETDESPEQAARQQQANRQRPRVVAQSEETGGDVVDQEPTRQEQPARQQPPARQNAAQNPGQGREVKTDETPNRTLEGAVDSANQTAAEDDIDAIRREGLTGRQLRMARRVAQKQGMAVTSDFDAVRQLRKAGIDPFQRSSVLELVVPDGAQLADGAGGGNPNHQLPQTVPAGRNTLPARAKKAQLPSTDVGNPSAMQAGMLEVAKIQKQLAARRRRKIAFMLVRLLLFIGVPTFAAGWYFYNVATPMYATNSEVVIQQAEASGAAGGLGSLFQGTSMATQQDSIAVQSYLASREAMLRLDEEHGFREAFSEEHVDPLQSLPVDATNEETYDVYQKRVKVSYDPTEGILRMEVVAPDPQKSEQFASALVGYAEEQVDRLTQRLREDQMAGARESYENAEARRQESLGELLRLQQDLETIDPAGETSARTAQIAGLQTRRQELQLELQNRLAVRRPNESQVAALETEISNIDALIAEIQENAVSTADGQASQAEKNTQLRLAEENYAFQNVLVQQAMQSMESAQIEANRQVRYLSLSVAPVAPDQPTYPRAFEDTLLAFLIFSGIYLMVSITGSILREQVGS